MNNLEIVLRRIIREEIEAALERQEQRSLASLHDAITEPVDETEEMAAVIATMTKAEWNVHAQRVRERRAKEE